MKVLASTAVGIDTTQLRTACNRSNSKKNSVALRGPQRANFSVLALSNVFDFSSRPVQNEYVVGLIGAADEGNLAPIRRNRGSAQAGAFIENLLTLGRQAQQLPTGLTNQQRVLG